MSEIKELEFIKHFEGLAHIESGRTNHRLIKTLFASYYKKQHRCDWVERGQGTTTTIIEWLKWSKANAIVLSSNWSHYKRNGLKSLPWRQKIKDIPDLIIIDSPLTRSEIESVYIFDQYSDAIVGLGLKTKIATINVSENP